MAELVGSVLFGADDIVTEMVRLRIPHMRESSFGPCTALGVVRRGELIGGAVFHNYRGHDIEMSAAFDRPDWCLPQTVRTLFSYPFVQLGCIRMTTITGRRNKRARSANERNGFKLEGVARRALDGREDAFIYSMLREECRWIPQPTRHETKIGHPGCDGLRFGQHQNRPLYGA